MIETAAGRHPFSHPMPRAAAGHKNFASGAIFKLQNHNITIICREDRDAEFVAVGVNLSHLSILLQFATVDNPNFVTNVSKFRQNVTTNDNRFAHLAELAK